MEQPQKLRTAPARPAARLSTRAFVIAFAVVELVLIVGALVYSKLG